MARGALIAYFRLNLLSPRDVVRYTVGVVALFLFLEITVRLYGFGLDGLNYKKMNSLYPPGTLILQGSKNHKFYSELKPNLNIYYRFNPFKTNSRGLRDKEYSLEKPAGVFRFAVLGSSPTMGEGIEAEKTFHSVLEDRLNRESKKIAYEFINFAVDGYRISNSLEVLKKKVPLYHPDAVLFCVSNEYCWFPSRCPKEAYKEPVMKRPFFQSHLWFLVTRKSRVQAVVSPNKKAYFGVVDSNMRELALIGKRQGIPVYVIVQAYNPYDAETIKKIANSHDLDAVTMNSGFREKKLSAYFISPLDPHSNAEANEIYAKIVYDFLMNRHLLEKSHSQ